MKYQIWHMIEVDGMTYSEIASFLKITLKEVRDAAREMP
jgi:DNA-directed RNA polymerase specialized sigma24 family protein